MSVARLRLIRGALILLACTLAVPARTEPLLDPDTQAARRHFERGLALYGEDRYAEAIAEFEIARQLRPRPALDYNIGRCAERLERWGDAIAAYQQFLGGAPKDPAAPQIRERIEVLRGRLAPPLEPSRAEPPRAEPTPTGALAATVPAPPSGSLSARGPMPPVKRAAIALAATGGVLALAGVASWLAVLGDYQDSVARCQGRCDPQDPQVLALGDRVRGAQVGAGVLWAAAGVALAVDVALWVRAARAGRAAAP